MLALPPALPAGVLTATFSSAASVPVTAASYTATGDTVELTLAYAPAMGATLTVVNNTGLAFITGTFANLAQGQAVALTYAGLTYNFVANYYGGTGNDLVLQWANTRVSAWGNNFYGQLGNNSYGTYITVAVPQSGVLAGKSIVSVSAGARHTVALCSDGTLAAWGSNITGQLGNNSSSLSSSVPVSVLQSGVLAGKTVVAVSAGSSHTVALCSDGTLAAWGYNTYGQLGNNSTYSTQVPVSVLQSGVLAGKSVVSVSAGYNHTVALCSDGTLAAWGSNTYGQLGNNSTSTSSVPVAVLQSGVLAGKTVVSVSAGARHTVALCSDGTLAAWGSNTYGQLGNNSSSNSSIPVAVFQSGVLAGKSVVDVEAGVFHTVALCSDGTLAAWGSNTNGQLGNNSTSTSAVPVAVLQSGVLAGKFVVSVSAGCSLQDGVTAPNHTVSLCSDGTLAAWGSNTDGQLGNNRTSLSSSVPVSVPQSGVLAGESVVSVSAGGTHTVALLASPPVIPVTMAATVQGNSATLNGTVNPNGGEVAVFFEYGTTTGYGTTVAANPASVTGSSAIPVSATVSGLTPDATYHYRLVLTQTAGPTIYGTDQSFTAGVAHTDADLAGLDLSAGTLSPSFSASTNAYTASVPNAVSSLTLTPTLADPTATVTVNGTSPATPVTLSVGENTLTVLVTAQDGTTTRSYTVIVSRATAYTDWLTSHGLTGFASAPDADPDADSMPNLLEFVLGGSPLSSESALLPTAIVAPDGTSITFTYRRQVAAATVQQSIQYTATLTSTWTTAVHGIGGVTIVTSAVDAQTEQVTATIPTSGGTVFARLSVGP